MDEEKKTVGRPRLNLDPEEIQKLAKIGCKNTEIADFFGCSLSHITKNYRDELIKGRAELKMSLRRAQLQAALGGNATMMIWLGKQILDQKDQSSTDVNVTTNESVDMLRRKLKEVLKPGEPE